MTMLAHIQLLIILLMSFTLIQASEFWIVTNVSQFNYNDECLAKACFLNDLKFRITHFESSSNETASIEWSANPHGKQKQLTSSWMHGFPDTVKTQLSIINYDPHFGFARVCDSSDYASFSNVTNVSLHNLTLQPIIIASILGHFATF